MAAALLNFGPVGWIMANIIANTSCLLVIIYYKAFPKKDRWPQRN
jgi:hypothetical protein